MADRDKVTRLGRLLGAVARAHHEATGGESARWVEWYAARLRGDIDAFVGFEPTADEIAGWLMEADERYRTENPEKPWPYYYAELILDSTEVD